VKPTLGNFPINVELNFKTEGRKFIHQLAKHTKNGDFQKA
jgi:hypothetical protein